VRTGTVLAIEPVFDISSLPPGPRGPKALTAAGFLLRGPQFLERCRDRYGHVFTIQLNTGRTVVIAGDPAIAKEVFTGSPDDLHAGAGNVVLKPVLGPRSVLLLDGPEHMRQRKLMLPPFHGERMRAYGELMGEIADRQIDRWPVARSFSVRSSTQAITLEIILRTVFGMETAEQVEGLAAPLRRLLDSTTNPARLLSLQFTSSERGGPRSPWGRVRAMLAPADEMIYRQIRTRRAEVEAGGDERDDILSLLLAARDEDGEPLTDRELRDELMTLLLAGHETTATALAWTLERAVRTPEVLERLQDEARDGSSSDYLEATIKETLRLRPVVPGVIRRLQRPLELGGIALPAGVHIAPSIYLIHRRADVYPEPEAFRPERFLGERQPSTYEWLPFGGGIRRCLGASFALYEMRIVLSAILRRATLEPVHDAGEPIVRRFVTFTPKHGGRVRISRLTPARVAQPPVAA
jgi:cytochrome P450 family 135